MMLWHFVVISPAQSRAGRESLLRANGHETPLFYMHNVSSWTFIRWTRHRKKYWL